jgi:glycosyltransferase involved in cell wall biosynthesis
MLHNIRMREPIVVYPEVTPGNPRKGKIVVRYLLNRPGLLVPGVEKTDGDNDYFIHYTEEHSLPGRTSFDAFMPLVDRNVYFPDPVEPVRQGFVVYSLRVNLDRVALPEWLTPVTMVSRKAPRSHQELAALYRQSRAMVTFERSTAIIEALHCGCPVICIDAEHLSEGKAYHRLFHGAGLVWGWHENRLEAAAAETKEFRATYSALEQATAERVNAAFQSIAADFARRAAATT